MFTPQEIHRMLLTAPPLLLSLTLHEYAHARMALAFGDPTAKYNGRVTLNPLKHLDPLGTLMILFSGVMGWARPVPVNPYNLHPLRLGNIMVSLAGPLTNLALAVVAGLALRGWLTWGPADMPSIHDTVETVLWWTAVANLGLCFFNLIPLFPLDGHHIVREMLPDKESDGFMRWQMRFGAMTLMIMIFAPRLIEVVTQKPSPFDPISLYLGRVIRPLISLLAY